MVFGSGAQEMLIFVRSFVPSSVCVKLVWNSQSSFFWHRSLLMFLLALSFFN